MVWPALSDRNRVLLSYSFPLLNQHVFAFKLRPYVRRSGAIHLLSAGMLGCTVSVAIVQFQTLVTCWPSHGWPRQICKCWKSANVANPKKDCKSGALTLAPESLAQVALRAAKSHCSHLGSNLLTCLFPQILIGIRSRRWRSVDRG